MRRVSSGGVAVCGAFLLLFGCEASDPAGAEDPSSSTKTGEQLYFEPQVEGNSFACATCHALSEPASDGFRRPAHPLDDALRRPDYKNGRVPSFLEAVNSCLEEWMAAPRWSEGSEEMKRLSAYLEQQSPAESTTGAPALSFQIVQPPGDLSGGAPDRGQTLFNTTCAVCHGQDAVGTERALSLTGSTLTPEYIAERVRRSGATASPIYDGLSGGRMPFWAADRLSDDELRDIVAFVLELDGVDVMGAGGAPSTGEGTSGVGGPPARDCPSTHEKIGKTAEFLARFHNVGGTAEIIDDCTIQVTDFTYDGTGIVVEMYGGLSRNFVNGFAVSGDLKRGMPYAGETLTLTLPEGKTLDDLDSLSVWCVDVAVSFGDAMFE